jgi:hypothetical protein
MKISEEIKIKYQEYLNDFEDTSIESKIINASGCFSFPMSLERFAEVNSWQYKLKQWFKYCWFIRKFNSLKFRIGIIWDAIFNVDRFNY